jgi:hypothetical protein
MAIAELMDVTVVIAVAVRVIVVIFRLLRHGRAPDFAHGRAKIATGRTVIQSIGIWSRSFNLRPIAPRRRGDVQHFFPIRVQGERRRPASVARHSI